MQIKLTYFAILVQLITINASKHFEDVNYKDSSESGDDTHKSSCIDGECFLSSQENKMKLTATHIKPTEEITSHNRNSDELNPNIFDLVKLLSLFANNGNRGDTKISFNIRDFQSGFKNDGSNYHVGNVHREINREKRDVELELNEDSRTLTTETSISYHQDDIKENNSEELGQLTESTTEISQGNNDNIPVDTNVTHTEADNFQDSNAADIYDSITNDTAAVSVGDNEENSDLQINISDVVDHNYSDDKTISQVDKNSNDVLTNYNDSTRLPQLPKVKIALTKSDLYSIQNRLNDDLGIESKGAKSVANFSLNGPLESGKNNPVIVMVYNCSCGNNNNHTHDNSTDNGANGYEDNTENDTEIFDVRRILHSDEKEFSTTEVTSKVTIPANTVKLLDQINDNKSNALLENELLQKCNSLLSLQLKHKANTPSDSDNLKDMSLYSNQETLQQLSSGDILDKNNDINTSKDSNSDKLINTDVANETIDEQFDTAMDGQVSNVPIIDTLVEENQLSKRKRRSLTEDIINSSKSRDAIYSRKSDVPEIINNLFKYLLILPIDYTENSGIKSYLPTNDKVTVKNSRDERRSNSQTVKELNQEIKPIERKRNVRAALNFHRNKRGVNSIVNYMQKHYDHEPVQISGNDKYYKDGIVKMKREVKTLRSPKYYGYINEKLDLLESDPNSDEYDGTVVNFKPLNNDDFVFDGTSEPNKNKFPSQNLGDVSKGNDLLNQLRVKPVHINIYLQLLLKNLKRE